MNRFLKKALGGIAVATALSGAANAAIIEINANITTDTRWTRDNVYVLTGIRFLLPPAKLVIEPGTLVRQTTSIQGATNPGALVVSRGAKVIANGTADDPIIFTSQDDTLVPGGANTRPAKVLGANYTALNYDPNGPTSNNAFSHTKRCGGLVICGRTPIGFDGDGDSSFLTWNGTVHGGDTLKLPTGNNAGAGGMTASQGNGVGFAVPEGLSITPVNLGSSFDSDDAGSLPASTNFIAGLYGGVRENDDSGVYRFMSHRYGGFNVSPANEINGVTLCGVGNGTVFEWQEVAQNVDDNFEWFGGYVNCKYLFGLFCGDDAFDGDQGYSGNIQHAFAINNNEDYDITGRPGFTTTTAIGRSATLTLADKLIEWDGPEPNQVGVTPNTITHMYNVTGIGNKGAPSGTTANDDAFNPKVGDSSQFYRFVVEDIHDTMWSPGNATSGGTVLTTSDLNDSLYFNVTTVGADSGGSVKNNVSLAGATQIRGKAHTTYHGLDPRLVVNTAGTDARDLIFTAIPSRSGVTDFFSPTLWYGGMRDNNMLSGWSWAYASGILQSTNVERPVLTIGGTVNPTITFAVPANAGGFAEAGPNNEVVYVVESSIDQKKWKPVGYVYDGATAPVGATEIATKRLEDTGGADIVTVTDTSVTIGSTPIHYRVIPQ